MRLQSPDSKIVRHPRRVSATDQATHRYTGILLILASDRSVYKCAGAALTNALHGVLRFLLLSAGIWLGSMGYSSARIVQHGDRPTLLVMPFDAYDYAMDEAAQTRMQLHRWAAGLAPQIQRQLQLHETFHVVSNRAIKQQYDKLLGTYVHPSQCQSCMLKLARDAGADYVVLGQVHKLSSLITYFPVRVDATNTGCTVLTIDMRADGANSNAMWRNIAANIAGSIDRDPLRVSDCRDAQGSRVR